MKLTKISLLLCIGIICSCTEKPSESTGSTTPNTPPEPIADDSNPPEKTAEEMMAQMEKAKQDIKERGEKGVKGEFIKAIAEKKFDNAFALINPPLAKLWTLERFTKDWQLAIGNLPPGLTFEAEQWSSRLTLKGFVQSVTYKLDSDVFSDVSLKLVSMHIKGKEAIMRVEIHMPASEELSEDVISCVNSFVHAMQKKDYKAAWSLFNGSERQQYSETLLNKIRAPIENLKGDFIQSHHRLVANIIWYDVVKLASPNNSLSQLNLIIQSIDGKTKIAIANIGGRM